MIEIQLTDRRPYIIRALYEWMIDNHLTPHLVINIDIPAVVVPIEYARNGQIILNIAPNAVENIDFKNEKISFSARFKGLLKNITAPPSSVIAIFARENSEGIIFENKIENNNINSSPLLHTYQTPVKNTMILSVIKKDDSDQNKKEEAFLEKKDEPRLVKKNQLPNLRLV
ncbi:Stringent starvation protein B [Candidatus Erwinia haradaeae]|uniref:Stringent starvation protein B n=1 Tax=Candidatus Erwinia haradaeae TaxID=1922217 RepID=A0A451D9N6_9GAMM|nr:Stringent starvation protein B [Candidatus Erwinia haradaeae]